MSRDQSSLVPGIRVIELELRIAAPRERVWKALVIETSAWWSTDFLTDPSARAFVIEPRPGGRMYEDWGNDEGLVWATVTAVKAPAMLELAGVSSPKWGGPRTHYHSFALSENADGTTVVKFSDAVHGRIDDKAVADLRAGWEAILGGALKGYCEA